MKATGGRGKGTPRGARRAAAPRARGHALPYKDKPARVGKRSVRGTPSGSSAAFAAGKVDTVCAVCGRIYAGPHKGERMGNPNRSSYKGCDLSHGVCPAHTRQWLHGRQFRGKAKR